MLRLVFALLFIPIFIIMALRRRRAKPFSIGFFHPYCNAGGGGERVLWCAIRAIQQARPDVRCVVYTGDNISDEAFYERTRNTFGIALTRNVEFVRLTRRAWVEADRYPYFTMLGQSLGSMVLGLEALYKFNPHVFFDSMGYAFTFPIFWLLGGCKVMAYVHYPTISTDMLEMVTSGSSSYNNAARIASSGFLRKGKLLYYRTFAFVYGMMGRISSLTMVNSSWTKAHIDHIWNTPQRTQLVFPPCDVKSLAQLPLNWDSREAVLVSIAQFRPEKNHKLQLESFAYALRSSARVRTLKPRLVLIGSCRDDGDASRVEELRRVVKELGIEESVQFEIGISNEKKKEWLSRASIGLHSMWCEHFGIGVVELMAAGVVTIAHNSGGPRTDIVKPGVTGYLAAKAEEYGTVIADVLQSRDKFKDIPVAARATLGRFSDEEFASRIVQFVTPHLPAAQQ